MKAPPQPRDDERVALGEHTDFGSVTVLFNRLGGLQVLLPSTGDDNGGEGGGGGKGEWLYIRPLPHHCIINLGDALVKFTNGLLRSNIHRVISPPGEQAGETRYSVVYFCRPEDEVLLRRLDDGDGDGSGKGVVIPELGEGEGEEEEVCAREWIIRRALGKRVGAFKGGKGEWERAGGLRGLGGGSCRRVCLRKGNVLSWFVCK